jgi:creatinine amidohydrolase/Fe(II)-dependent formamide hydrolase-like protein
MPSGGGLRHEREKNYPGYEPGLFSRNRAIRFSQTGLLGDPTKATAEKGKQALAIMTRQWLQRLQGFTNAPLRTEERVRR